MKKKIGLVIISLAIFGILYPKETKLEKKETKKINTLEKPYNISKNEINIIQKGKNKTITKQKTIPPKTTKIKKSNSINIPNNYNKKKFYYDIDSDINSTIYQYYNKNGNLSKEIEQESDGYTYITKYKYYKDSKSLYSRHYILYNETKEIINNDIIYYNKLGKVIEGIEKIFDYENKEMKLYYHKYTYDKNNNLIKEISKKNGSIQYNISYEYNNMGKETLYLEERYDDDILLSIKEHQTLFDTQGNEIKKITKITDSDGIERISYIKENHYNNGKLLSSMEEEYDNNNELVYKNSIIYNDFGNMIEEHYLDEDYYYIYNEKNQITQEIREFKDSIKVITSYTYDSKYRLIEENIENYSNGYKSTIIYGYDKNDNKIFEEIQDNEKDTISNTYWEYNEDEKLISFKEVENDNIMLYKKYNEREDIIEIKMFDLSGLEENIKFIYNEDTHKLQTKINSNGKRIDYFYNKDGELIKKIDENGNILYSLEEK